MLCCSVAQSYLTLCNMPGFPVLHHLLEFAQTHVHWVGDIIQPSHPLSPSFSFCLQPFPASASFPMSKFFPSGGQSIGVSASILVLPINTQDWSPLGWTGLISLLSEGLAPQLKSISSLALSSSLGSNSHIHPWLLEKPQLWLYEPLLARWCLCCLIHCLHLS